MTIHIELGAAKVNDLIWKIRELKKPVGLAINPPTVINEVEPFLDRIDLLLIMTVNPGFGGQEFIPYSIDKIRRARLMLDEAGSDAALEVDGGISRETINEVWSAGADTFVAGNAVFSARDPKGEIAALRASCGVAV